MKNYYLLRNGSVVSEFSTPALTAFENGESVPIAGLSPVEKAVLADWWDKNQATAFGTATAMVGETMEMGHIPAKEMFSEYRHWSISNRKTPIRMYKETDRDGKTSKNHKETAVKFKIGDTVRLTSKHPQCGFGHVKREDVGIIAWIGEGTDPSVRVDFPVQRNWFGYESEFEPAEVKPIGDQVALVFASGPDAAKAIEAVLSKTVWSGTLKPDGRVRFAAVLTAETGPVLLYFRKYGTSWDHGQPDKHDTACNCLLLPGSWLNETTVRQLPGYQAPKLPEARVSKKWLEQEGACTEGLEWFVDTFGPDGNPKRETVMKLLEEEHDSWADWLRAHE